MKVFFVRHGHSVLNGKGIQGVGNGFKEIVTGKAEIENSLF